MKIRGDYHPGNVTVQQPYRQESAPPQSYREVETRREPVLYSHDERPIYRRVGFTVKR